MVELEVNLWKQVLINLEHEIILIRQVRPNRPFRICTSVMVINCNDASPVLILEIGQGLLT